MNKNIKHKLSTKIKFIIDVYLLMLFGKEIKVNNVNKEQLELWLVNYMIGGLICSFISVIIIGIIIYRSILER